MCLPWESLAEALKSSSQGTDGDETTCEEALPQDVARAAVQLYIESHDNPGSHLHTPHTYVLISAFLYIPLNPLSVYLSGPGLPLGWRRRRTETETGGFRFMYQGSNRAEIPLKCILNVRSKVGNADLVVCKSLVPMYKSELVALYDAHVAHICMTQTGPDGTTLPTPKAPEHA